MNGLEAIINQLEQQGKAIERALEALRGVEGSTESHPRRKPGRPRKDATTSGGTIEVTRQQASEATTNRQAAKRAGVETLTVLTGGFSEQELRNAGAKDVFTSVEELRQSLLKTALG